MIVFNRFGFATGCIILAMLFSLLLMARTSSADVYLDCDDQAALLAEQGGGQVGDNGLYFLHSGPYILECCCFNNDVEGSYWSDPYDMGEQGSCSCQGWSAPNCKEGLVDWYANVIIDITPDSKNLLNANGFPVHGGDDPELILETYNKCFCYDSETHVRVECFIGPGGPITGSQEYCYTDYLCGSCS